MSVEQQPAAAKLLMEAFMQVRRTNWHGFQGYKPSQIKLLYCLKRASANDGPGLMVSEISRLLHVTSPTVTQLLKELEDNGLIERKSDLRDRRVVRIHLSDRGQEVIAKASEIALSSFHGLMEHLGEEESVQLASLLKKSTQYLRDRQEQMKQSGLGGEEDS